MLKRFKIMANLVRGKNASAVRQKNCTLFVEGEVDETALKTFLNEYLLPFDVKPLGTRLDIQAVAKRMLKYHPEYFYLVDRDFETIERVNQSWEEFPDKHILIWPKRELENYFIDPAYLNLVLESEENITLKSGIFINDRLLHFAQERLTSDAINIVMRTFKVDFKEQFIDVFWDPKYNYTDANLATKINEYITKIKELYNDEVKPELDVSKILEKYKLQKQLMLGERQTKLAIGTGTWLNDISGKKIFSQLVNNCFIVKDRDGNEIIDNKEKQKSIIKALLSLELKKQPEDFKNLIEVLKKVA